jgi:hypothetical protein
MANFFKRAIQFMYLLKRSRLPAKFTTRSTQPVTGFQQDSANPKKITYTGTFQLNKSSKIGPGVKLMILLNRKAMLTKFP